MGFQNKLLVIAIFICSIVNGQILKTVSSEVSFFSEAPLEDIQAKSKGLRMAINNADSSCAIIIPMNTFDFPNDLMEEHYNENYLETEKFPKCKFLGKISAPIDLSKDGTTPIIAKGKLTLHGVTKDFEIKGNAVVKDGKVTISTMFQIKLEDFDIEVPSILVKNIAEIIDVTAKVVLEEKK
jgi:polyisoprenoid-binding protein YceI